MLVCSGLSTTRHDLSLNELYVDTFIKFQIMEEKINKMESFAGVKKITSIEIGWFSIFNEYLQSEDVESVLSKFNISIGDFIRAGKEASELSTKLFNIYRIKEFKMITDIFNDKLSTDVNRMGYFSLHLSLPFITDELAAKNLE